MKSILFLIIVSAIFYGIWRWNSPYPYTLNWDIWEHQTVVNAIRGGSFAVNPSELSDTFQFNGYTTAFHVIIAGFQAISGTRDILGFWWIAEGAFFMLTTIAMYFFAYTLTKNKLASVMAGVLSAGFFESSMAYTTLFLIPQTLAAVLWVIAIILITRQPREVRLKTALLFSLTIILLHGVVGIFGGVLLLLYVFALRGRLSPGIPLAAFALGYGVPALLASRFPVGSINAGEALHFTQTIGEKLALVRGWYGFLPIPFLLMGSWKGNRAVTALFSLTLGVVLSPFPYVLKFTVYMHYLMIALMAGGLVRFATLRNLILITIAAGLIFVSNAYTWQKPVLFHGIASQVSSDEIAAAKFLKSNYEGAFLVSDPATQGILEALSGIDTQGGPYMNTESRKNLLGMNLKPETFLAVSARTMKWFATDPKDQMSIAFNVWRPDALSITDQLYIARLGLNEIYRNPSIVLFKL